MRQPTHNVFLCPATEEHPYQDETKYTYGSREEMKNFTVNLRKQLKRLPHHKTVDGEDETSNIESIEGIESSIESDRNRKKMNGAMESSYYPRKKKKRSKIKQKRKRKRSKNRKNKRKVW